MRNFGYFLQASCRTEPHVLSNLHVQKQKSCKGLGHVPPVPWTMLPERKEPKQVCSHAQT